MAKFGFDPFGIMRDLQERAQFLLNADKQISEVVVVLKDAHHVLEKIEAVVDRLDETISNLGTIDAGRIDRIENAVLNIERATLSLEASMGALPRRWHKRVERMRKEAEGADR